MGPAWVAQSAPSLVADRTPGPEGGCRPKSGQTSLGSGGTETIPATCPLGPAGGGGVKGPAKSDYRRLLRKPYKARIEPTYASGHLVPPQVQAAVGLDKFRARHLRPILRCTQEKLCTMVPWRVAVMPSLVVTIDSVKTVLRKARESTPLRDLIEYCMIEWLHDTELQWVVALLESVSTGVPLRALVHSDFYALPAKVPHGPIVNAHPLLNFTTMLKLVGVHIPLQYVPLLARPGVLPCTQFALHASSSVADLLSVLHEYIWFCFFRRQRVCLVVDDVGHAYGSVVRDTRRWLWRLAGFPDAIVELLLLATTEATIHMGSSKGVLQTALDPLHESAGGFCTLLRPGRVRRARAPWHDCGVPAGLGNVAGPFLVVTIYSVKTVLRKTRESTPFCDLIEHCMSERLHETELQWVVEFLESVSTGVPVSQMRLSNCSSLPPRRPPYTSVDPTASRKHLPPY